MNLFDVFKPSDNFDKSLDRFNSTVSLIPIDSSNNSNDVDEFAINTILSAAESDKTSIPEDELSKIFTDLEQPKDRLSKFQMYEAIYNNVQLVKRAITVYMNNTFLRNPISNKFYTIHPIPNMDESKFNEAKQFAELFFKTQNFFDKIKKGTKDSLIYGDGYLEFIDLNTVKVDYPVHDKRNETKAIHESVSFSRLMLESKNKSIDITKYELAEFANCVLEFADVDISHSEVCMSDEDKSELDQMGLVTEDFNFESSDSSKSSEKDGGVNIFKRFIIRHHHPSKIIELDSDYGMTLGYVQISVDSNQSNTPFTNVTRQFMNSVNIAGGGIHGTKIKKKGVNIKVQDFAQSIISRIIDKTGIVKDIKSIDKKKATEQYQQDIEAKLAPEVIWAIRRLLVASGKSNISNPKIKVRYIKPSNMFNIEYPGGTSVVDTMAYPAKLYLLIQLTNLLSRLSKAATIRKWTLDIGSRENASTVVRRLKNELRNQRITANDMTTSDISNIITDFKDLITISKNGKPYVDVQVENLGDPSTSTQDLEFQRNELVAVSGIPAAYLGYNDGYELRDQLVHANISFANEIMGVQSEVNSTIMEILDKASLATDREPISKYLTVSLTPPMVLMLQVMETVTASFSTVYSTIKDTMGLKVDPVSLLEQFVPYADWKSIVAQGKQFEQEKKVNPPPADQGGF